MENMEAVMQDSDASMENMRAVIQNQVTAEAARRPVRRTAARHSKALNKTDNEIVSKFTILLCYAVIGPSVNWR